MKNFIKWSGIVLGGLIGLTFLTGLVLYPIGMKKLTQIYPKITVEAIKIPTNSDAVVRGGHLAIIWSCTKCHGTDLSGTLITSDPVEGSIPLLATIPASNLTSGIGGIAASYTDSDWIRAIRHGVKPNGRVEILMNDYSNLSDQDLGDLIAYLKKAAPVDTNFPEMSYGPLIPLAPAVGVFTPAAELTEHEGPRPAAPPPGATNDYGKYLSGICTGCHGNSVARKLEKWSQDEFVRTFKTGVLPNGKHLGPIMSSKTFSELNDTELTALWLYFMDVRP